MQAVRLLHLIEFIKDIQPRKFLIKLIINENLNQWFGLFIATHIYCKNNWMQRAESARSIKAISGAHWCF